VRNRIIAGACAGLAGAVAAAIVPSTSAQIVASSCTDISQIPVQYELSYGAAIQGGIFHDYDGSGNGCDQCHTGGFDAASGNLDLDALDTPSPYANLINVESAEYAGRFYVVPNHPELSLLFQKINCATTGAGEQMPQDNAFGGLTAYQQALVYDWIAAGAPSGTTDVLFRNTFDIRGFFIDEVFGNGFEQPD
jgi:hypothetical protein